MRTPPGLSKPSRHDLVRTGGDAAAIAGSMALATLAVAFLEGPAIGIPDASPVYLVAVVAVGALRGTWPAIVTALAAVALYDFLFTEPRYTLTVADPREWLDLLLFLFVAVIVGRLTAATAERALEADMRAREAQALFGVSRTLATAPDLEAAAPSIVDRLAADAGMDRVRIGLEVGGRERIVADSAPADPPASPASVLTLARTPDEQPSRWVRTHLSSGGRRERPARGTASLFRVKLESDGKVLGSLWGERRQPSDLPSREETRLLALAADQVALAVERERLSREATRAEIARQSDALKTALLDTVSHDLRTPLASIRAAAGAMADPATHLRADEYRRAALAIDLEAQRLGRLVSNMLDLSRIEAGALRPELEVFTLAELVEPIVDRLRPLFGERTPTVDLPEDLPPVRVDSALLEQVLTNLLENAARYAPSPAVVRVAGREVGATVELIVEDGGPGVPVESLPRLFDKFYRVERPRQEPRRGLGIGLSVVQGFVEAMGGRVDASASELGGLAVRILLPAVPTPVEAEPPGPAIDGATMHDAGRP